MVPDELPYSRLNCAWYVNRQAKLLLFIWLSHFSAEWVFQFVQLTLGSVFCGIPDVAWIRANASTVVTKALVGLKRIPTFASALPSFVTPQQALVLCTLKPAIPDVFAATTDKQRRELAESIRGKPFGPTVLSAFLFVLETID